MSNVPRISLKNMTGEIVISSIPDSVQNYDFESMGDINPLGYRC